MSGFIVILSLDGRPVPEDLARSHLEAIAHRGDREPRLWLAPGVALGHVNLPTTPEAEDEVLPAADPTGRFCITWDGRIDNRAELARALDLEPTAARQMTDAGYVLAAYQRWGDRCVERLLGDWVFAIWDSYTRRLFCANDPLGWRQCFFAQHNGLLLLGSEPQQLFAGGFLPRTVNHDYLLRYLGMALQRPGDTCFAGVRQLEGGQSIVASGAAVTVSTDWRHPPAGRRQYRRPEEYVDEFVAVFREATEARLRSNRRIGVYLSGGLDSSYVAAIAAGAGADMSAITAYAPDTRHMDERAYARLVSDHLGIDSIDVDIGDCWSLSRRWLTDGMFDEPVHQLQSATHLRLALAARDAGLGVMLGGEGGDEWLTGDDRFLADAVINRRFGHAWRIASRSQSPGRALYSIAQNCYRDMAPPALQDSIDRFRGRALTAGFSTVVQPRHSWVSIESMMRAPSRSRVHTLERTWRLYREMAGPAIAWRERHAFAPNGIELRTPFNDLRVVELMAATPDWVKWCNGRTKDVLRTAEERVLPRVIPDRTDWGFYRELMQAGVFEQECDRVDRAISAVIELDGVSPERAQREIDQWRESRHRWWQTGWRLITAGLWLDAIYNYGPAVPASPVTGSILTEREVCIA